MRVSVEITSLVFKSIVFLEKEVKVYCASKLHEIRHSATKMEVFIIIDVLFFIVLMK